jgi:hypothetical protein
VQVALCGATQYASSCASRARPASPGPSEVARGMHTRRSKNAMQAAPTLTAHRDSASSMARGGTAGGEGGWDETDMPRGCFQVVGAAKGAVAVQPRRRATVLYIWMGRPRPVSHSANGPPSVQLGDLPRPSMHRGGSHVRDRFLRTRVLLFRYTHSPSYASAEHDGMPTLSTSQAGQKLSAPSAVSLHVHPPCTHASGPHTGQNCTYVV